MARAPCANRGRDIVRPCSAKRAPQTANRPCVSLFAHSTTFRSPHGSAGEHRESAMHANKTMVLTLGLALAMTACQQKRDDAEVPQPGQMMAPVGGVMQPPPAPGTGAQPAAGVPGAPN